MKTKANHKGNKYFFILLFASFTLLSSFLWWQQKPTLYIIGDSTVRNGDGTGKNGQWGWGNFMADYFDTTKISVQNHAIGGRSSRTFVTEGRWDKILNTLKKGDYVIMQFGHNDAGPLDDTARARGTIRGIDNESKEIYNPITKKQEVVYSYGWYMRKYVQDTKAKGAIPIVCSLIPRNQWKDGKVQRSGDSYGLWAADIAKQEGVYFIDLNNIIADRYDKMDTAKVSSFFFGDHTHTNEAGAKMNVAVVVEEIRRQKPAGLQNFLR